MRYAEHEIGRAIGPVEVRDAIRFDACASSDRMGWVGVQAASYREAPSSEVALAPLTHHTLVLINRPPEAFDLRYDGVNRHMPPAVGSIIVVPAGSAAHWRWSGPKDSLHVYLEPDLFTRVAAEAFELDPARVAVPPIDALNLPHVRAAMMAVDAELTAATAATDGGSLAVESLANLLSVHLIRHVLAPGRPPEYRREGALPQGKLRAVVEYVEEHLRTSLTLEQMAAAACLSPYHFARQFKAATGLPPHQYVIARRVERAQRLLQAGDDRSLGELALSVGFSDQSQFSNHFKRLVGATPRQFRLSAATVGRG